MKHEEQFDEVARRKLAQREFAFEEAHWEGVQAALGAKRKRRPAAWLWAVALLLVGGGALWYGTLEDGTLPEKHASTGAVEVEGAKPVPSAHAPAQEIAASTLPAITGTEAVIASPEPLAPTTGEPSVKTERSFGSAPAPDGVQEKGPAPVVNSASTHTSTIQLNAGIPAQTGRPSDDGSDTEAPRSVATVEQQDDFGQGSSMDESREVGADAAEVAALSDGPPATASPDNQQHVAAAAPPRLEVEASDSAAFAVGTPSPDSTINPEPVRPPSQRSWPLEATLWGGPSWTNSKYSGGNSTEWINGVSGEQTWNAGAELMVMQRNFGFGIGAHYASYQERFNQEEVVRHQQELRNSYFFNTIDTTVTIVIDTVIQNDTAYYVTQQINTTINVLDWTTDTTVTTIREREAVATRNVASYVEIPLLLDAHLTQGRWLLGLRGGPTVGILSGHRGPLPGSSDGGLVPFNDMVFGYTARAYVRYHLGPAWSIGIEPGLRGHFGNALGNGDLVRRNSSMGVMFGLTYRFR